MYATHSFTSLVLAATFLATAVNGGLVFALLRVNLCCVQYRVFTLHDVSLHYMGGLHLPVKEAIGGWSA